MALLREIVLDTETTGLSTQDGHRIVEIGCVELIDGQPSGRCLQSYINPMRDMPSQAFRVHGLSQDFLRNYPTFEKIITLFLDFIQDSVLVIHNAKFDMGFLNFELGRFERPPLSNMVIDTLDMAKKKFPGAPASLDALCRRFRISLEDRGYHGALLDAHLLSKVYANLHPQEKLNLTSTQTLETKYRRPFRKARVFPISPEEQQALTALLEKLGGK